MSWVKMDCQTAPRSRVTAGPVRVPVVALRRAAQLMVHHARLVLVGRTQGLAFQFQILRQERIGAGHPAEQVGEACCGWRKERHSRPPGRYARIVGYST